MKIGPVDIRNHMFAKRAMRGLDEGEVRAYLDLVADCLEESVLEVEDFKTRIDQLEARLADYGTLERTLRDSLVAGERVSEERLLHADREARIVIKNAEVDAEKIVGGARQEVARLRAAMDDLRRQRITYAERFRALLRSQFKILEASLESYDPDGTEVDRVLDEIDRGLKLSGPLAGQSDSSVPGSEESSGAPEGFHAPPPPLPSVERPPSIDRPPSGDAPLSSYLGEEGLFSPTGADDEHRSEEG